MTGVVALDQHILLLFFTKLLAGSLGHAIS